MVEDTKKANIMKLEELLNILDKNERHKALVKCAQDIGVKAVAGAGSLSDFSEERLAILIYDRLQKRLELKSHDINYLWIVLVLCVGVLLLISMLPKLLTQLYKENNEIPAEENTMQDDIVGEEMDGIYRDYDDQGRPTYQYHYRKGVLVLKKTFNKKGEVISVERGP